MDKWVQPVKVLNARHHSMTLRHYGKVSSKKPLGNAALEGSFGPYSLEFGSDRRRLRRFADAIIAQLDAHG